MRDWHNLTFLGKAPCLTTSTNATLREPPRGMFNVLRNIGPGIVVSGSVIGSGELINTPKRAAEYGFVILWAVVFACLIKYWLQVELGRYCLANNLTTIQALNTLPGPKFRRTHVIPLLYCCSYVLSLATLGGILTATAGLLRDVFGGQVLVWAFITYVVTIALLYRGIYSTLEVAVSVMVAGFSFSVLFCLLLIQLTDYRISLGQIAEGFTFRIPEGAGYAVISLMGALGTTANEMFMYPYWILENGYAKFVGPRPEVPEPEAIEAWYGRARGWIHVLKVDAACATAIATVVTLGYYLTGAAVLRGREVGGLDVVKDVSRVFTETYGEWSFYLFMFGGFCTLYSTLVVVAAATGRMGADVYSSLGYMNWNDERKREKVIRTVTIAFLTIWLAMALGIKEPANYIAFGQGINGIINTPLLLIGITFLAFRMDKRLRMGPLGAVCLLASVAVIALFLKQNLPDAIANMGKVFSGLSGR